MPRKLTKVEKTFFVDDGNNRGPMTMLRVRFHPREDKLVAACADRRLARFDLAAGADQEVKGHGKCVVGQLVCPHEIGWVRCVDFHPGGKQLATGGRLISGGEDGRVIVWDTKTWQPVRTMVHEALVSGEMPPKDEPQPSAEEKQQILTWIIDQATQQAVATAGTQRRLLSPVRDAMVEYEPAHHADDVALQKAGFPVRPASQRLDEGRDNPVHRSTVCRQPARAGVGCERLDHDERHPGRVLRLSANRGWRVAKGHVETA